MGPKFEATLGIPKIMAQIAFSVATRKCCCDRVLNLYRRSLLQHVVVCRDLLLVILLGFSRYNILFFSIFILSRQSLKIYRDRSFLSSSIICLARFVFISVLCRNNLMCGYWNSYVATSTLVSRQCFCVASSNSCSDPVFMSRQHVCLVLVASMFLILSASLSQPRKSVATWKVCRDRVLLPLNLISCCSFILILRHSLLVLLMFFVAT